jgi:hypothetical protein
MTCHRGFLPSFGSFGKVVSEEKIKKKSANQIQELHMATMFVNRSELNKQSLQRTFSRMLPTRFRFIWQSGFRGDNFFKINQSETIIAYGGHVC